MENNSKLVVLIHGWLGRPGAFGRLPKMLRERGHDVLPIFHQFDSWPRGVTVEELSERLEVCLARERRDRPMVLISHSLGGLVALTWMLRFHAEKGQRPPVERFATFGTPRHGVVLRPFARAFVDWGLVPGTALARQMRAPNPFLWDLAWSELRHSALLPPMVFGAGVLSRPNPVSALVGGRESDSVVPAICVQPNAVFARKEGPAEALPSRAFRVFEGRAHNGPRGLYAGLRSPEADARSALLMEAVEDRVPPKGSDAQELGQALCIVRHPPRTQAALIPHGEAHISGQALSPSARNKDGLTLFLLTAERPGASLQHFNLLIDGDEGRGSSSLPVRGGQVVYIDSER